MNARRIAVLALSLVVAVLFMPSRFGGPATYVTTHGNSMEPLMHSGDLVIARRQSGYHVGDVVAYQSKTINTVVLHRIVSVGAGNYTTKGDNNSWLDPDRLTGSDILGVQWLFIPRGGQMLERYASTPTLAALIFLLIAVGGTAVRVGHNRARKRRHEMGTVTHAHEATDRESLIARRPELLMAAAAVAALGLLLSLAAWTRPSSQANPSQTSVPLRMAFAYSAPVAPSPAYQGTQVVSPDPVFRKLADKVTVGYTYQGVPGTVTPEVRLSTTTGWTWRIAQKAVVPAPDGRANGQVDLDLDALERLAKAGTAAAGVPLGTMSIDVVPKVTDGADAFEPALQLTMDGQVLRPAQATDEPLVVEQSRDQTVIEQVPSGITLLFWSIPIWPARLLGLLMLGLGAGAGWAAWKLPKPDTATHLTASEKRLSQLIVPVSFIDDSGPVVDVADLEALAKIARRYALVILHVHNGGGDIFYVKDIQTTYRWMAPPPAAAHAGTPLAPWTTY